MASKNKETLSLHLESAARLFRALGDESRLRLLEFIYKKESNVSEIALEMKEGISTISQRLRLLRSEGLVKRTRVGKNLYYSLEDEHIKNLITNAIEHVSETHTTRRKK